VDRLTRQSKASDEADTPKLVGTRPIGIAFISPMIAILMLGSLSSLIIMFLEIVAPKIKIRPDKTVTKESKRRSKNKKPQRNGIPYFIIVKEADKNRKFNQVSQTHF